MECVKLHIDEEPDKFAHFMKVYHLYNPLFPLCGDDDGVGFETRVLAAWDTAVGATGDGAIANLTIKCDLLTAASCHALYLVSQLSPQDQCFAGLSFFMHPPNAG